MAIDLYGNKSLWIMIMMSLRLALLVLVCLCCQSRRPKGFPSMGSAQQSASSSLRATYEERVFPQKVTHFNFNYSSTYSSSLFNQRFLIDNSNWSKKGPILLYFGNEGPIEMFYKNSGFYNDIVARELQGLIVYLQHRYFGQSMPFGDKKTSFLKQNLVFLTSQEAMMDMVDFIKYLKRTYCSDCPVIVFGGSYGGMLAAWMRIKYPHVVDFAHAASAPLYYYRNRQNLNLGVFYELVTKNYQKHNSNCVEVIREAFARLSTMRKQPNALIANLSRYFNLCTPLKTYMDIPLLMGYMDDAYSYMAMLNYPYPTSFLKNLTAWPANSSCTPLDAVTPSSDNQLLFTAVRKSIQYYYSYNKTQCNEIYEDNSADEDMSGWNILACADQAMPMTSDGLHDMFYTNGFDYSAYSKDCRSTYGIAPDYDYVLNYYGGVTDREYLSSSNIIFTNGGLDPWSGASPVSNLSDTLVACFMPNGAHHLDLRPPNPADPPDVTSCRNFLLKTLKTWIQAWKGNQPEQQEQEI